MHVPVRRVLTLHPILMSNTRVRHLNHPPDPLQQLRVLAYLQPQGIRLVVRLGIRSTGRNHRQPPRLQILDSLLNHQRSVLQVLYVRSPSGGLLAAASLGPLAAYSPEGVSYACHSAPPP